MVALVIAAVVGTVVLVLGVAAVLRAVRPSPRRLEVQERLRDAEVALAVYEWWTDGDVAVERRNARLWVVELGDETRHARSVAEVRMLLAQHWGSR